MDTVRSFLKGRVLVYGIAVLLIVVGSFLLPGRDTTTEEFLTVVRGHFVQEVSVSGKVVAAQGVDLGFSQSGRVKHVYANVSDRVAAGTILAELDNSDLRAGVLQKQAALEHEQAALGALAEGTRPEEVAIARSEVASSEVALAQTESAVVESVQDAFTTSDDAVRNTLDQFIDEPRTNPQIEFIVNDVQLENTVENARRTMENTLAGWQKTVEALTSVSDLSSAVSEAQSDLSSVVSLLTDANAALNKAVPTGSITQTVLDGYKVDIALARTAVNAAISSLTTSITAQRNAISALETSRKNLLLKEAGTRSSDVEAQKAQVKAAEADLASVKAQLEKTIMRAPFAGLVTKMDLKVGSITSASLSEVSMISAGMFQIESFIPEVNIALIEMGDTASVTLDAYGSDVVFTARVTSIDPAETVRDGVSTYRTLLRFESKDDRVRSGMTANVVITTDMREGVLSIPRGIVVERDGKKYVRVRVGEETGEREVVTGAIDNLGNIEILAGLSEGDTVVLPASQ